VGGRLSLYGLVIVGAKPTPTLHAFPFLVHLAFSVDWSLLLHAFFPWFPSLFARFFNGTLTLTLTLCPPSRISLFFLGIALYIKTCLEPHRIRTTHVPSTGLVSFLSSHYSSSFFLSTCLTLCPFWGFCLFSWRLEVLCLVLFLPRVALSCRVPSWSIAPFPLGLIVCCPSFPFLVYFTSFLLSHSVTHPQANVGLVCRIPVPLLSLTIVYNVKAAIFLLQVPCKFFILYAQCSISEYSLKPVKECWTHIWELGTPFCLWRCRYSQCYPNLQYLIKHHWYWRSTESETTWTRHLQSVLDLRC